MIEATTLHNVIYFGISIDMISFRVHQGNKKLTMTWAKKRQKKNLKQYTCREGGSHKTHYGKDSTLVEGHALYNKAVLTLTGHTNPFTAIWLKLAF